MATANIFLPWAKCGVCKFGGLLQPKNIMVRDSEFGEATGEVVAKSVCITCFHTPDGIPSENLNHKRLPDKEYLGK